MYRHFLFLTTIVLINDLLVCHPLINNVRVVYKQKATTPPFTRHTEIISSNFKYNNQYENKVKFHNISKNQFIKDNIIDNQPNFSKHAFYHPQKHIKEANSDVDLNNCIYKKHQKQCDPKKNDQQHRLRQVNKNYLLMLNQLDNKSVLSEGYLDFSNDLNQKMAPIQYIGGNSNDYYKAQNLTAYVTPSPSHAERHLDLHHRQLNYNMQAIVSHDAAGSEASPITATSLKTYKPIYNTMQFFKTVTQTGSNQYIFSPKRSSNEKQLSQTSNTLPYPPSFISITTTERPQSTTIQKLTDNKIPDLFLHRQYKSLWDSYIPSWEITNMLQQFQNKKQLTHMNNNLHTLAIIRPFSTFIKQ